MNQPRNEARITNLEKECMTLGARIEEAAADRAEELKAIRQEVQNGHIDIGKAIDSQSVRLMQDARKRFDAADQKLIMIEQTMATKEELTALETRVNKRFDKLEATQTELNTVQQRQELLLREILNRLLSR